MRNFVFDCMLLVIGQIDEQTEMQREAPPEVNTTSQSSLPKIKLNPTLAPGNQGSSLCVYKQSFVCVKIDISRFSSKKILGKDPTRRVRNNKLLFLPPGQTEYLCSSTKFPHKLPAIF